jgi:hypothetical protein
MTLYVDPIQHYPHARTRNKDFCHLCADTEAELHKLAQDIGVGYNWFDPHPRYPHYDLNASQRQLAIESGAVACKSSVAMLRQLHK